MTFDIFVMPNPGVDINECETDICPEKSTCENSIGSFTCTCDSGHAGELCLDVDECLKNVSYCDEHAKCTNSIGSYHCDCNTGYYGNGKVCFRGQCDDTICSVNEECVSSTSMKCKCKNGFLKEGVPHLYNFL